MPPERSWPARDEMDEYLEKHGEPEHDTTTLRNVIAKRLSKATAPSTPSAFVAIGDGKKGSAADDGAATAASEPRPSKASAPRAPSAR